MPIYEYRCDEGHEFEVIGKFTDDPLTECQVCGAPVQKVLHPPAIHFKGSGFHNTDYGTKKRNREKAAHEKSKADSASSSDSSSSSSDTKKSDAKKPEVKASASSSKKD
ncbi:MAG TPA: FmdB family zinc ribbon protein [Baekduia sp.]|nr:FmdB family zinc ribbon protein [Baekduia sp.]